MREYREFERTSTAVLNAYVGPTREPAIWTASSSISTAGGFRGNAMIMQSGGGTMAIDFARGNSPSG